jgi:xylitol oxidase
MSDEWNWARNYRYGASPIREVGTVEEVQEQVMRHRKLKVLGTRHSFNGIADSPAALISLRPFDQIEVDPERGTVTVGAGVTYGQMCAYLHDRGYAVHNLASLPHISVVGACATATHGSGDRNGNLATAVSALEMVTADGNVKVVSRNSNATEFDEEEFEGMVVGLGALGVVTRLTLDLLPAFDVAQEVYLNLPWESLEAHFDAIVASAYSVSLFTDWKTSGFNQVWIKRRVGDVAPIDLKALGAPPALCNLHPLAELSAENCTEQMGVAGPWHERLPHFRMNFQPSSGDELQSEYFVPRERAIEALQALSQLRDRIHPLLWISEVRTIAADRLWMSPCYGRDSVGLHFTWKKEQEVVEALLPAIEAQLAPFDARPHWGKLFTLKAPQLELLYPKLPQFRQLVQRYDPERKFRNEFLHDRVLG